MTLVERYRFKRSADTKAKSLQVRAEQARAKIQRDRYLEIQAQKQKAKDEIRLVRRENMIKILIRQQKFFAEQKKNQAKHQKWDNPPAISAP